MRWILTLALAFSLIFTARGCQTILKKNEGAQMEKLRILSYGDDD
jgi:hypothetical protein